MLYLCKIINQKQFIMIGTIVRKKVITKTFLKSIVDNIKVGSPSVGLAIGKALEFMGKELIKANKGKALEGTYRGISISERRTPYYKFKDERLAHLEATVAGLKATIADRQTELIEAGQCEEEVKVSLVVNIPK